MKKVLSVLLVLLVSLSVFAGGGKEKAVADADDQFAGLGNYVMMIVSEDCDSIVKDFNALF